MFPKFLELFFTPEKTPPKVKNIKPDKRDIFGGDTLYISKIGLIDKDKEMSFNKNKYLDYPEQHPIPRSTQHN